MKKPKNNTRKSVSKRFKVTGTGKILHRAHGSRHLKSAKSKKRRRSHKVPKKVKGAHKLKIRRMLGI